MIVISGCTKQITYVSSTPENLCYEFILNKMVDNGGVHTNYMEMPHDENFATGYDVLSESQGLLMRYASIIKDKEIFKSSFNFTLRNLNTKNLFAYRYDFDNQNKYLVNAAVDDLRIIRALLEGANTFSKAKYKELAEEFAYRFYNTNVKNNFLYDFYDENVGTTNDFITLCYIDLDTISKLPSDDWTNVYYNMCEILKAGYISDEFPMFMTSYNYNTKTYQAEKGINMVESLLSVLNLSSAGLCSNTTINYIKQKVKEGVLYGNYNKDGQNNNEIQSTAIYAICAMIGKSENDSELYNDSIMRMEQFRVDDKNSSIYGAFGNAETFEVYSFDNLMALIAYRSLYE